MPEPATPKKSACWTTVAFGDVVQLSKEFVPVAFGLLELVSLCLGRHRLVTIGGVTQSIDRRENSRSRCRRYTRVDDPLQLSSVYASTLKQNTVTSTT